MVEKDPYSLRARVAVANGYQRLEKPVEAEQALREAIEIAGAGTAGFHLSFDMDGCDPVEAPGVGTPVTGGVTQRESHLVMEHAAESGSMLGLEITEINPIVDERNRTAELAVELVLSALGKRIV